MYVLSKFVRPAAASSLSLSISISGFALSQNGCHEGHLDLGSGPLQLHLETKFGESLGGSQAPLSFWKVPALPRKFPGDFPGGSLTVDLDRYHPKRCSPPPKGVPRIFDAFWNVPLFCQ